MLHDSTHSGWGRRKFCSACTSGCWARFGDAGSDVDVPLIGGPSGTAHPSDSCVVVFTKIDADLESQLEIVSEIPAESIGFSSDGRLPTYSVFGPHCCMGREMQRSRGKLCAVPSWLRGRRTGRFKSSSGKGAECEKGSETFGAKRDRGPSSEASMPSRICWQVGRPRSQWSCSHSNTVQFEPCDVGDSGCFGKVKQPSATRDSHFVWSRRRHQSHPSPCQAISRSPTKKRLYLPANLSTLPKYLQS